MPPAVRALLAVALLLPIGAAAASTAHADLAPPTFSGDHRVVGESGADRRAVWGLTAPGATVRFYAVDKAAPGASCQGAPIAAATAPTDDPRDEYRWDVMIERFRGIVYTTATLGAEVSPCVPVFLSTLPMAGTMAVRSGTAVSVTTYLRRSNPASDVWPLHDYDYVVTDTTSSQLTALAAKAPTIDVGGIVLEAADRPWRDVGNLRFGTSYTKLNSSPGLRGGVTGAGRASDVVYGRSTWPFARVRVFAGTSCDDGAPVLATAYADDQGRWATPVPVAPDAVVSSIADFDGMPTPSDAIPRSFSLDLQFRASSPDACQVGLTAGGDTPPPAPTGLELVPDPADPDGALVRGSVALATTEAVRDAVVAYASRDASCTGTGAWLGLAGEAAAFAAGGMRITDTASLDLDRVGVRLWQGRTPSACVPLIAKSDRAVTIVPAADEVAVGGRVPIEVRVANAGPWPSKETTVRIAAASGAGLEPADGDTTCAPSGADLVCALPSIDAGTTGTIRAVAVGTAAGSAALTATLAPQTRDTVPANDDAAATVRVLAAPTPDPEPPVVPPVPTVPDVPIVPVLPPATPAGALKLGKITGAGAGRTLKVAATVSGPGTIEAAATHTVPRSTSVRAITPGADRLAYARLLPTKTAKGGAVSLTLARTPAGRRAKYRAKTITLHVVVKFTPAGGQTIRATKLVRVRVRIAR